MDSLSRLMSEFLFGVGTYFFHYFLFQTHGTLLFLCSGHKNKLLVYKVFFAWMLGRTIISLNYFKLVLAQLVVLRTAVVRPRAEGF